MNLLIDPWIKLRRKSGESEFFCPSDIGLSNDPIVAVDWNRPDFTAATHEFLIGLLQATFAPKNEKVWIEKYLKPPTSDELQEAFAKHTDAFNLDGDGERFMQDRTAEGLKKDDWVEVRQLLVDSPGDNTLKNNADLFVKRSDGGLSYPALAIALYTLQTYAPSGGQGHRTSLRGGGPLTTILVAPDTVRKPIEGEQPEHTTLWHTLWLNVLPLDVIEQMYRTEIEPDIKTIYPWMKPVRVSKEPTAVTTQSHMHPVMMYFGMPRRIFVDFETATSEQRCSIQPEARGKTVLKYSMLNYGENYPSHEWQHPLSPYYQDKEQLLPDHPQPGGVKWKHWLGCVVPSTDPKSGRKPARVIEYFRNTRINIHPDKKWSGWSNLRVRAFGYDMKNKEARCWYEGTMPVIIRAIEEEAESNYRMKKMYSTIENLVASADVAVRQLCDCIGRTLEEKSDRSKSYVIPYEAQFWTQTETQFYEKLKQIAELLLTDSSSPESIENFDADIQKISSDWCVLLERSTIQIFEGFASSYLTGEMQTKRLYEQFGELKTWLPLNLRKTLELTKEEVKESKNKRKKKEVVS